MPDYHDVIVRLGELDVLPVGTIPPNPTELFFNPRFAKMMEELKENYDYVILDCPPVDIVADATIISRYAEMTLFIIRAHLMDRSFLADIETWYQERRYPNISVILNGLSDVKRRGYGYGYGYDFEEKKGLKKILSKIKKCLASDTCADTLLCMEIRSA